MDTITGRQLFLSLMFVLGSAGAAADAVWIDVRSQEEYRADSIAGDLNIPFREIGERIAGHVPDKNAEIALYCDSGGRSWVAQRTLEKLGYARVRNAGGIDEVRAERGLEN